MLTIGNSNLNLSGFSAGTAAHTPHALGYHDPVYSDDPGAPQGVVLPSDNSGVMVLAALALLVFFLEV